MIFYIRVIPITFTRKDFDMNTKTLFKMKDSKRNKVIYDSIKEGGSTRILGHLIQVPVSIILRLQKIFIANLSLLSTDYKILTHTPLQKLQNFKRYYYNVVMISK